MIRLPPLTLDEVRILYAATHLLRSLVRHAAGYHPDVQALRPVILDVRSEVVHRFPTVSPDGLYRLPALISGEHRYLLQALANLTDGLGNLAVFGGVGDCEAPRRLAARLAGGAAFG